MHTRLSPEEQIVVAIRRIVRAVDLHSKRLVEEFGLTGPQLATLQEIHRLGSPSPTAVARRVHLSQATVTGILQRLEKNRLIVRTKSDTDKRGFILRITPEGAELLERAPSLLQDRFRGELRSLEEWERTMILAVLQRVASLMDASELDASPYLVSSDVATEQQPKDTTPAI